MKRLLQVFELTIGEQRVIVVLLASLVLFAAARAYLNQPKPHSSASDAIDQPSPSPGIRP